MSTTTDIAVYEPGKFVVLAQEPTEVSAILASSLIEGETIDAASLPRIKMPSGGATSWEVPTVDGSEPMKTLTGVLVYVELGRAYWPHDSPNGAPPACRSVGPTSVAIGEGDPGGPCAKCRFAEYGTAIDDTGQPAAGQACNASELWFMLLEQSGYLPHVIKLPATSLKPAKTYRQNTLGNYGLRMTSVVTEVSLLKAKSASGKDYAVISPRKVSSLAPDEAARAAAYASGMREQFSAAAQVVNAETGE